MGLRILIIMHKHFWDTSKQKGQGIVEYALLLAFIVGIAMDDKQCQS